MCVSYTYLDYKKMFFYENKEEVTWEKGVIAITHNSSY
jgi:hypothetical protein